MTRPIYLDYNATTPVAPEVLETMLPFLKEHFGNPSSDHAYGRHAAAAVKKARQQVARLLGCEPEEILFTAGGTESDNLAILGSARAAEKKRRHAVTSSIEHPAVVEPLAHLERAGWEISRVPVGQDGRVNLKQLADSIRRDTALVTLMLANNETGALQPIAETAALCRKHGAVFHCDAAQAVGKIPVHVEELGIDLLTVAGHKLYAPMGVGALFVRRGTKLHPLLLGAQHERGLRSGTENVASIVGLGAAAELARRELPGRSDHLRSLRERLHRGLLARVPDLVLNGPIEERLPNTLNVSVPGLGSRALLEHLAGIATSSGAACHAGVEEPSAVLMAMGISAERALGALRLTVGRPTTPEEIDLAVEQISDTIEAQRRDATPNLE